MTTFTGWEFPPIIDALLALLIFLLSGAIGVRVLRRFELQGVSQIERGLFAFGLGLGIVSYLPFVLFTLHLGKPAFVVATFVIVSLLFAKDQLRIVQYLLCQAKQIGKLPTPTKILLVFLLPILFVTFLQALCPPTDPDGLHYHLTAPQFYLREGRFFYAPTFLHLNWPLGIEMLFALGMAFHSHYAAGIIQFGIGLILLLAIYRLCLRVVPANRDNNLPAIVGCLTLALSFPPISGEMTWAYIDLGMGLFITLAAYALHLAWERILNSEDKASVTHFWTLAALFAGLSATAKLPGLFVIILVALIIWGQNGTLNRSLLSRTTLRPVISGLLLGFLIAAPWLIRSWAQTGTPIYPYFANFLSVKDRSPEFQHRLNEYLQYFVTLPSKHLTPKQVIQLRVMSCGFLAILAAVLAILPVVRLVRPLTLFCCGLMFVQIAASGIYLRYFLPFLPLMIAMLLWSVHRLLAVKPIGIATVVVSSLWLWGLLRLPQSLKAEAIEIEARVPVILHTNSRDTYLAERLPSYPIAQWCNANLPKDAIIILGIYDSYASLYDRQTLVTQYWLQDAIRYNNMQVTRTDLKRLGATHLIMSEQHLSHTSAAAESQESDLRERFEFASLKRIAQENGTVMYQKSGYTVFALHLP